MALAVVGLRAMVFVAAPWVYPVMWVAMMIIWTLELFALWTLAGAVHDAAGQAPLPPLRLRPYRRRRGGGLLTGPLAGWLGAENLLLLWVAALLLASLLSRSILKRSPFRVHAGRRARSSRAGLLAPLAEEFRVVRGPGCSG